MNIQNSSTCLKACVFEDEHLYLQTLYISTPWPIKPALLSVHSVEFEVARKHLKCGTTHLVMPKDYGYPPALEVIYKH